MLTFLLILSMFLRVVFATALCTLLTAFLLALLDQLFRACGFSLRRRYHFFSLQRTWPLGPAYRFYKQTLHDCYHYYLHVKAIVRAYQAAHEPCPHGSPARRKRSRLTYIPVCDEEPSGSSGGSPHVTATTPSPAPASPVPPESHLESLVLFHHAAAAAEGSRLSRPPRPPRELLPPPRKRTHSARGAAAQPAQPNPPAASPVAL